MPLQSKWGIYSGSLVVVAAAFGCGHSSTPADNIGDAADTGGDDAPDAETGTPPSVVCGDAPRIDFIGKVVRWGGAPPFPPASGARVIVDVCPTDVATTDAQGRFHFNLPKSKPLVFRIESGTDIPTVAGEFSFDSNFQIPSLGVWSTLDPSLGYVKTEPLLEVQIFSAGTGPCGTPDGVEVSDPGHLTTAVVVYPSGDPPKSTTATSTGPGGVAFLSGIPEGFVTKLTGAKGTCGVRFDTSPRTGRIPVRNGAVTLAFGNLVDGL